MVGYVPTTLFCKGNAMDKKKTLLDKNVNYYIYLKNKEDGNLPYASHKKIWVVCPICNHEKEIYVNNFSRREFSCPKCGDKTSYPNRFMFYMLSMLNVDFKSEVKFSWSNNRVYDFVVNNIIIEMDGGFHKGSKYKSYEECKRIDNEKDLLAISNGYKIIRIDCNLSDFELIKNNIINSELYNLYDLNNFDWNKLEISLYNSNIVKLCCETFNTYKGKMLLKDMAEMVHLKRRRFSQMLKIGSKANLTDYNVKSSRKQEYRTEESYIINKRPIKCLNDDTIYKNSHVASKVYGISPNTILDICNGIHVMIKGYEFDYIDTTKEIQELKAKKRKNSIKTFNSNQRKIIKEEK